MGFAEDFSGLGGPADGVEPTEDGIQDVPLELCDLRVPPPSYAEDQAALKERIEANTELSEVVLDALEDGEDAPGGALGKGLVPEPYGGDGAPTADVEELVARFGVRQIIKEIRQQRPIPQDMLTHDEPTIPLLADRKPEGEDDPQETTATESAESEGGEEATAPSLAQDGGDDEPPGKAETLQAGEPEEPNESGDDDESGAVTEASESASDVSQEGEAAEGLLGLPRIEVVRRKVEGAGVAPAEVVAVFCDPDSDPDEVYQAIEGCDVVVLEVHGYPEPYYRDRADDMHTRMLSLDHAPKPPNNSYANQLSGGVLERFRGEGVELKTVGVDKHAPGYSDVRVAESDMATLQEAIDDFAPPYAVRVQAYRAIYNREAADKTIEEVVGPQLREIVERACRGVHRASIGVVARRGLHETVGSIGKPAPGESELPLAERLRKHAPVQERAQLAVRLGQRKEIIAAVDRWVLSKYVARHVLGGPASQHAAEAFSADMSDASVGGLLDYLGDEVYTEDPADRQEKGRAFLNGFYNRIMEKKLQSD